MARYLSRESEPFGRWKGIPIYLTTILTAALVLGLFLSAFMMSAGSPLLGIFTFYLPAEDWTEVIGMLTYPLIDRVTFFTPFALFFFYWLAVGVETHLGRTPLVKLLLLLVLIPCGVAGIGWWIFAMPTQFPSICLFGLYGTFLISAALIVAFATLYPNAEWLGWVPFKWVAFACVVCGSLMAVSHRDWMSVAALWTNCLAAFLFIRHAVEQEYDDHVPFGARFRAWFRRKPRLRVLPAAPASARPVRAPEPMDETSAEVDALLDKIAKSGLQSLTKAERARLEKAREELLKKGS